MAAHCSCSKSLLWPTKQSLRCGVGDWNSLVSGSSKRVSLKVKARSDDPAADAASLAAKVGQVTEVSQLTFSQIVKAAGDKVVVLHAYTQWCGPCKEMAPKLEELSKKYQDVLFLKLDYIENQTLAKKLGIKLVPTFKILRGKQVVKEVKRAQISRFSGCYTNCENQLIIILFSAVLPVHSIMYRYPCICGSF